MAALPAAAGLSAPYPGYPDMWAPYGRHPVTGQPYSDKSKVTAALLQLLGLFGFLGFGRMYLGQIGLGIFQLLIGVLATVTTYGIGIGVPIIWGSSRRSSSSAGGCTTSRAERCATARVNPLAPTVPEGDGSAGPTMLAS